MEKLNWSFENYEFRILEQEAEEPQVKLLMDTELGGPPPVNNLYSDIEKENVEKLRKNLSNALKLRVGVYTDSVLVAYFFAYQTDASNLHMGISVVHSEHRRRGIYSAYLNHLMIIADTKGFQTIDSYHFATNNPVLIAKLRADFVISGISLLDTMGTLVHLTYYKNPKRRELAKNRCGMVRPSAQLRELFF